MKLSKQKCSACKKQESITEHAVVTLQSELEEGWEVINGHHLEKSFHFTDFASGLAFVNLIGTLAEEEGHHPDIHLSWGRVRVAIWTHALNGLSQADFILAAKIDKIPL